MVFCLIIWLTQQADFSAYAPEFDLNENGGLRHISFAPAPGVDVEYANLLLESQRRNKLDWEDPHILSADVGRGNDLHNLV